MKTILLAVGTLCLMADYLDKEPDTELDIEMVPVQWQPGYIAG